MNLQRLRFKRRSHAGLALFAMFLHALVASLPMPVAAGEAAARTVPSAQASHSLIQVCTVDGIKQIDVSVPPATEPAAPQKTDRDCPICKLLQHQTVSISLAPVTLALPGCDPVVASMRAADPVRDRTPPVRCALDPPQTL
jgi:hypothetical protein